MRQAAVTVRNLRPSLRDLETQLSAINILGSQPFGRAAALFGTMATDLEGLDTRLDLIATDLEGNRGALVANAQSLDALGTRLAARAGRLRSGMVHDGLADVRALLLLALVAFLAWTAVPAVGALALGWWLRRELDPAPSPFREVSNRHPWLTAAPRPRCRFIRRSPPARRPRARDRPRPSCCSGRGRAAARRPSALPSRSMNPVA